MIFDKIEHAGRYLGISSYLDTALVAKVMEQPYVIGQVREKLRENIMDSFRSVRVVSAELGNRAGMLGASCAALEEYHESNKGKKL